MEKQKRISLIGKSLTVNDGKILFVRRYRPHQRDVHNKWELPGGKVEFGESPYVTCERECFEETGFVVKSLQLVQDVHSHIWKREHEDVNVVVLCYAAKLLSGEASVKDKGVSEVKWFLKNELPKKENCIPGTLEFVNVYLSQNE